YRELPHPVLCRRHGEARRPGVDRAVVDVPAVLVRLLSMEAARFEPEDTARDSGGNHFVGDMAGVLPMVAQCRLRQLRCRRAMWKRDRSERGVADRSEVDLEHGL